jgi:hypothetical protein
MVYYAMDITKWDIPSFIVGYKTPAQVYVGKQNVLQELRTQVQDEEQPRGKP